jgi:hypothetical protein
MDRPDGGADLLSAPTTVLATPLLGTQLSRELVARIEAVDGVHCERITADGRIHGDRGESVLEEAEVLLLGAVPASVLDHLVRSVADHPAVTLVPWFGAPRLGLLPLRLAIG